MTKEQQLSKNRIQNPKRFTKKDKKKYIDFLRDKSEGICQIPYCNNPAQDWEHPKRGINRDDRETILICRHHHQIADQPSPTQIEESKEIKKLGISIAIDCWREFNSL